MFSSSSEECSSEESDGTTRKKQRKMSICTWDNVEMQSVRVLPEGVDGLTAYEIKPFSKGDTKPLKDGRKTVQQAGKVTVVFDFRTVKALIVVQQTAALLRSSTG